MQVFWNWDITSGDIIRVFEGHNGSVISVVFSPDGRYIAQTTLNSIVLWDAANGSYIRSIP